MGVRGGEHVGGRAGGRAGAGGQAGAGGRVDARAGGWAGPAPESGSARQGQLHVHMRFPGGRVGTSQACNPSNMPCYIATVPDVLLCVGGMRARQHTGGAEGRIGQ